MPKIYDYLGIVFLFYSNEHEPLHVHAKYKEAVRFVEKYAVEIAMKWHKVFVLKEKVVCEEINKKI